MVCIQEYYLYTYKSQIVFLLINSSKECRADCMSCIFQHVPSHCYPCLCKGGCGYRSSRGLELPRYRCIAGCDYDLCGPCMNPILPRYQAGITSDGTFVYVCTRGSGVYKVGTGINGSAEGKIYAANRGIKRRSALLDK